MNKHQIFYDADCPLCAREAALLLNGNREAEGIPIQGNEALLAQYGISTEQAMTYLHARTRDGEILSGMAALRLMHNADKRGFWWIRASSLPLIRQLADWLYPRFARNRYRFPRWLLPRPDCENGRCTLSPSKRF